MIQEVIMWHMKTINDRLQDRSAPTIGVLIALCIAMVIMVNMATHIGGQYVTSVTSVSDIFQTNSLNGSNGFGRITTSESPSQTQSRLSKIRNVCDRHNAPCKDTHKAYSNVLVDDIHRVIYCFIPKVACTSFKALLFKSAGYTVDNMQQGRFHAASTIKDMGLKFLNEYDDQESQYRLQHYFKFMAVRHPFDRLVSAYKDKFEHGTWSRFYCLLFEERTNGTVDCPYLNKTITFAMFAELVADGRNHNGHWGTYGVCKPCCIQYDHIVKLETFNDDIVPIMNKLFPDHNNMSVLEHRHIHNEHRDKAKEVDRMFSGVPKAIVNALTQRYRLDFEMFGYTLNE